MVVPYILPYFYMVVYILFFTVSQQHGKVCDTNTTEMKKFTPPDYYGESILSDPGDKIHK